MSTEAENTGNGHDNDETPKPNYGACIRYGLILGVAGVIAFGVFGAMRYMLSSDEQVREPSQLYLSFLVGFVFWLSFPIGSMAMLFIQYLTTGQWGLLMQRSFEACTRTFPLFIVLFIPLGVGLYNADFSPYWWTRTLVAEEPAADHDHAHDGEDAEGHSDHSGDNVLVLPNEEAVHELEGKQADFLNPTMFWVVGIAGFVLWGLMCLILNLWSKNPENGDEESNQKNWNRNRYWINAIAGPVLAIHAMIVTAVSTQWVMSLEMTWHSTMFPVIFGINQLISAYAFSLVVVLLLSRPGYPLEKKVTPLHQIDLGSFLLAFTLFWTYINFSQYMLVWVGNLPEEIPYFIKRTRGGWEYVALVLLLFHFAVPFLLLLFRHVKYNSYALRGIALMLLVMCSVDVIWWIESFPTREGIQLFWLLDIAALVGIGGFWFAFYTYNLQQRDLLPKYQEYRLRGGSHDHEHH